MNAIARATFGSEYGIGISFDDGKKVQNVCSERYQSFQHQIAPLSSALAKKRSGTRKNHIVVNGVSLIDRSASGFADETATYLEGKGFPFPL